MSGEVVHFEIPGEDVERARKFYRKTFGWKMRPMPELDYTIVQTAESDGDGRPIGSGAINGGILLRQDFVQHPVMTIMVDDIDKAAKSIERNGGKILQKKSPIGDGSMGSVGYFKDSEGNTVGLFQRGPG
jgi:uncharacterized protein